MSASGSSSPRGAPTPPPGGDGPSPLVVGTHFVKKYYHSITTNPDVVANMYQPASTLSVGLGSEPAQPECFETLPSGHQLKERFSLEGLEDWSIRFEFEHGAIDAQMSVNGGILLVATGHVVYMSPLITNNGMDEEAAINLQHSQQRRKGFVHTFFLRSMAGAGGKKTFSVQNDILRFLQDDEEKTVVVSNTTPVSEMAEDFIPPPMQIPATVEESPPPEVVPDSEPVVEEFETTVDDEPMVVPRPENEEQVAVDMAPGGGVEESKEPYIEDEEQEEDVAEPEPEPAAAHEPIPDSVETEPPVTVQESPVAVEAVVAEEPKLEEPVVTTNGSKVAEPVVEPEPAPAPAPRATPGSWAGIVATGKGTGGLSAPNTPARSAAAPKSSPPTPAAAPNNKAPTAAPAPTDAAPAPISANAGAAPTAKPETKGHAAGGDRLQRPKRGDPDNTLVIKGISAETTDVEVRGMFEVFAIETGSKVLSMTVSANRGIAFVDFSSPKPVLAAVEKAKEEPLQLNGRTLEIYQKAMDNVKRGNQGGRGRGYHRGGTSGGSGGQTGNGRHHQYRRTGSGAGRGDRGGGGGSGRGGRGGRSS